MIPVFYSEIKYPAAYKEFNVDPKIRGPMGGRVHVRVYANCLGYPIPTKGTGKTSTWVAAHAPGCEWAHPNYECHMKYGEAKAPGILMDIRTTRMLKAGCCPPEWYI